jgi:hypothetical protein
MFKHIFFWLSGSGARTLEECPNWEQRKYVAFGATVLVPCLFAFMAASYAVSTLTSATWIIYSVATLWAFIILAIDRALLASYRPYMAWYGKFGQFGLRFCVAVLLGITIAHPLTLMLFKDTIHAEIERDRLIDLEKLQESGAEQQAGMEVRIAAVENGLAAQREKLAQTYQATFITAPEDNAAERAAAKFAAGKEALDTLETRVTLAQGPMKQGLTKVASQLEELTPQLATLQGELDYWQKEYEREINGQRSGLIGVGPRAKSVEADQLAWRRSETLRLASEIEHLTAQRQLLQRQIDMTEAGLTAEFEELQQSERSLVQQQLASQQELRRKVEEEQASNFVSQQEVVRAGINQQIELRTRELERLQNDLALTAATHQAQLAAIREAPRQDLLTQTLALHALFERGEEGGHFALTAYLLLIALFLLVDTIPLMMKFFSKPGPYDTLVDCDEMRFDKNHRAFLTNYSRYIDQATTDGLASLTRNRPLEDSLVTGIERSRAAKAFIESLVELENAFQIRMESERATLLAAGGNSEAIKRRLAVLEEMAENFQTDLRRRMEDFFRFGELAPRP